MTDEFSATVVVGSGRSVAIALRGEIDMKTAPDMQAAIDQCIAEGLTDITLDMADVAFMDSSGLAVLASTIQRLGQDGSRLTVRDPTEIVGKVLEISRLADLLEVSRMQPNTTT